MKTEYVDILLLHRPDALMEPEQVAEAFNELLEKGKVKCFGVSNHNPAQIELLNSYCDNKIKVNQIQYSIAHCPTIDAGLNVNIQNDAGCNRDGSVIEYCRPKIIQLQAWSPFQYGMFEGTFIGSEKFPKLNKVLNRLAEKYGVTANAIAIAWILKHPAGTQAIVGRYLLLSSSPSVNDWQHPRNDLSMVAYLYKNCRLDNQSNLFIMQLRADAVDHSSALNQ